MIKNYIFGNDDVVHTKRIDENWEHNIICGMS